MPKLTNGINPTSEARVIRDTEQRARVVTPRAPMFHRVLAGIDFSSASLAGARWALTHVAPAADVLLAHVIPFEDSRCMPEGAVEESAPADLSRQMSPAIRGGLGGFAATLETSGASTAVRVGRPSHWLERLAAGFEASLIVLGRRHDARRKRIGEASVVERLTRRTSAPVLVVPEGVVEEPRCVIAAVDEGASGEEVLAAATSLSAERGLPLVALHVLAPASGTYDRVLRGRGRIAATSVEECMTKGGDTLALVAGDAAREIVAAGVINGAGLLVVGKRGADEAPVGSLGSVARELLATSPLPVLAIDTGTPRFHPSTGTRHRFVA